MKRAIYFLVSLFLIAQQIGAHTITYQIRVFHLDGTSYDVVESGSFSEGESITFPDYTLRGDVQGYQSLYNVVYQSVFSISDGALNENIAITLDVRDFHTARSDYYFDLNLFLFMGITVQTESGHFYGYDDYFPLNAGTGAYLKIPDDANLRSVLTRLGISSGEIDFAYYKDGQYDQNGISASRDGEYYICQLSHFSKFGGGKHSALPVELTDFYASVSGDKVELKWQTATEVNNYGFEIERSKDKAEWTKVGFVQGNGNSNSPHEYYFVDKPGTTDKLYYRLKQIDLDGTFEYSNTIEVNPRQPKEIKLNFNYPNPFNNSTVIEYSIATKKGSIPVELDVYNMLGKKVASLVNELQSPGVYRVVFDASELSSGVYYVQLKAGESKNVRRIQLIK